MKRVFKLFTASAFIVIAANATSFGQERPTKNETVRVVANTEYDKAGKVKRILLGEHYRKEWATPVEVEVLDLDREAGGLTADKLGGGLQTKSLRLKGANGKEYVLRSVNKDPARAIPQELVGTIANDVVQDQISSSNPFAPMVVASLSETAGIYHIRPKMVYVPTSTRLGEFEKEFAGTVCLFEERPDGDKTDPNYGFSSNIINSEKLFQKLLSDPDHRMDQYSFLKARLFDMWIGDWDRHQDQWLWAASKFEGLTYYKPIPRDRDQAFAKLDGVLPSMATRRWAIRHTQHFDYKVRDLKGLNMSGYFLDKNFTNKLTLTDWLVTVEVLQGKLTDEAIERAFREMPVQIYKISGESIIDMLKKRRNDLQSYAIQYYKFLAEEVYVLGSEQKELFEISRLNNDSTLLIVYKPKKNGMQEILYERVFHTNETKEIRLYGFGGDDEFQLNGDVKKGTMVRIIGGEGNDQVLDSSSVKGWSHKTRVYDNVANNNNSGRESKTFITNDTLKNEFNQQAFKYNWLGLKQTPGYNPDDGVYLGGGIIFKKQQFGKFPYGSMHSIWGNYAIQTGAYNFWYEGIYKEAVGRWDLHIDAKINAPNYVRNFYGMGNETEILVDDKSYYRVRSNDHSILPSLHRQFGKRHSFTAGLGYQSIKLKEDMTRFVSHSHADLDSTIFDRKYYASANVGYQFSTLDNSFYHRKGMRFNAGAKYTTNLEDSKNFLQLYYESAVFFSKGAWTAAFRSGVATNLGDDYEFFQANTLGGSTNLRGYKRDRFSGKTSLYNNTEVRVKLSNHNGYIFRGEYGLLSFLDNGREWIPGEDSNTWHYGYGVGFWALAYNRLPLTVTYGMSKESNLLNIKAGFLF